MPAIEQAQFDPAVKKRRAMYAKINIARQQLRMDEDDYRALVSDASGKLSLRACSDAELVAVLKRLEGLGFQPLSRTGQRKAQHPMARKARALWISLHQLGVVRNPSEKALEAFATRQLGCTRLAWANQGHAARLIEALKAMADRNGWAQVGENGQPLSVPKLQEGLCVAIVAKLAEAGAVPDDWTIDIAAKRLCGIDTGAQGPFTAESYATLAAALGRKLRALVPDGAAQ